MVNHDFNELWPFAPITGAWIETTVGHYLCSRGYFAPITGAWIETTDHCPYSISLSSHLSQVRGLKHKLCSKALCTVKFAPITGAWIET